MRGARTSGSRLTRRGASCTAWSWSPRPGRSARGCRAATSGCSRCAGSARRGRWPERAQACGEGAVDAASAPLGHCGAAPQAGELGAGDPGESASALITRPSTSATQNSSMPFIRWIRAKMSSAAGPAPNTSRCIAVAEPMTVSRSGTWSTRRTVTPSGRSTSAARFDHALADHHRLDLVGNQSVRPEPMVQVGRPVVAAGLPLELLDLRDSLEVGDCLGDQRVHRRDVAEPLQALRSLRTRRAGIPPATTVRRGPRPRRRRPLFVPAQLRVVRRRSPRTQPGRDLGHSFSSPHAVPGCRGGPPRCEQSRHTPGPAGIGC